MLLRASGEKHGQEYNLGAITHDDADAGVPHSDLIRRLTDATIRNEWNALENLRDAAQSVMGLQSVIDVLTVAAGFNGITRVADSTGIPLDENIEKATGDLRTAVGIDSFHYSAKSERYDSSSKE